MAERDLYDTVERWAKRHFHCWETAQTAGPLLGRIDVVGVRDVGGDLAGRSEVIAIEVKGGNQPFVTSAGQAYGYSVMADRCYLADYRKGRRPYNDSELLVAGRLGIGLAAIRPSGQVVEVLTAPPHEPIEHLRLQVIEKLGLATCALCEIVFRRADRGSRTGTQHVQRSMNKKSMKRAVDEDKGLMWWLETAAAERDRRGRQHVYWRRYLCPDCVQGVFVHLRD